ncbi:hypothetical protein UPYG_G00121120 [Umbra pygmaea]|uniref:Ig-like domain-containing protein n=1 Tax=Umbra pygmaea TaxID=75934 RepID=A0ABD0XKD4_UMBPY
MNFFFCLKCQERCTSTVLRQSFSKLEIKLRSILVTIESSAGKISMTVTWATWTVFFSSLFYSSEVIGLPNLEPLNATVLEGSNASFTVSLSDTWVSISWTLKNILVLTISKQYGVLGHDPRFIGLNKSSANTDQWEFIIQNVWRNDTGPVHCAIQNMMQQTAQLSVQVNGSVSIVGNMAVAQGHQAVLRCEASGWFPESTVSWTLDGTMADQNSYNTSSEFLDGLYYSTSLLTVTGVNSVLVKCLASVSALTTPQSSSFYLVVEPPDWTVLIAVVCSIGGFALLVLLIIGIVFCYKRRNKLKSDYQEEMSRSRLSVGVAAGQRQGHDNKAYVIDGQKSVTPSEFNDSGYSRTSCSNVFEIPEVVNRNREANGHASAYNTLGGTGHRKHRHVTIV